MNLINQNTQGMVKDYQIKIYLKENTFIQQLENKVKKLVELKVCCRQQNHIASKQFQTATIANITKKNILEYIFGFSTIRHYQFYKQLNRKINE
ncbi:hypothetical protein pb186bvf_002714 [Paramecium bursaria]